MSISVIISHLNNAEPLWFTVQNTVDELRSNGIEYEVIISDAGSNVSELDFAKKIANAFADYSVRLIEYTPPKDHPERLIQSCPGTRLAGIVQAKHDLICFMDSHVLVRKGFFNSMIPLFDDPDVYVGYAPMAYNVQLRYGYTLGQVDFNVSADLLEPQSSEPYPICAACPACTMIRKDILKLFFPEDELNYISYTMDEPMLSLRAWMFGKKSIMNPKTSYAHSFWRHSGAGNFDFECIKPMAAFAFGGIEPYEKAVHDWSSEKYVENFRKLDLPNLPTLIKDREFIEKNAVVKYKDLLQYLTEHGVTR